MASQRIVNSPIPTLHTSPLIYKILIIVCCHAIWLGDDAPQTTDRGLVEEGWLIESFQQGESGTFVKHIEEGIQQLRLHQNAILVFSGGPTKRDRTHLSEADSYILYARKHGLLESEDLLGRTFRDATATDSFQNVLFTLLQFPLYIKVKDQHLTEKIGPTYQTAPYQLPYPQKLILISHEFKRARFEDLHLPAVKYPVDSTSFKYIGIDPPFDKQKMLEIKEGDAKRGYGVWRDDIYGTGQLLASKRVSRGWRELEQATFVAAEEKWLAGQQNLERAMSDLFENVIAFVKGTRQTFPEKAPWS